jgi:hypothetical protein
VQLPEPVGDAFVGLTCAVDDDREQKGLVGRHSVRTIDRELPFKAEVSFDPSVRIRGDDWNEEGALADLLADLAIPGVPAPQFALVEPDLDTLGPKCIADPTRSIGVLRSVAKEYRLGRRGHLV